MHTGDIGLFDQHIARTPMTASGKITRNTLKQELRAIEETAMDISQSARSAELAVRIRAFMAEHIYPNERRHYQEAERLGPWAVHPVVEELKPLARPPGCGTCFCLAHDSDGLTNLEYAPLCEIMGRSHLAPEVFNCSAPDTGNMETILRYGTEAQKEQWLKPLLAGEIRSSFAMTEPDVASSDATNIASSIVRAGDRLRHQWTQMVHHRGNRSALQDHHLHGPDRSG